jgi:hypothetical protein
MKQVLLAAAFCWSMSFSAMAQEAKYGMTPFGKVQHPAVSEMYQAPATIVEEILKKKMTDAKLQTTAKSSESGFKVMKGVKWNEIATQTVDVYFKVEGNKEKTASTVYLMTSLGNDNFFTNENHPQEIQNMMTFLDGLVKEVTVAKALADLKPVEASVVAAEKKVDNLKKEGEKLVAEKKNTETKIADNVTEQGRLQTELDNQERLLEIAKSQTGTVEQMTAIKKDISKQEDAFEKIKKKLATAVKDADKMKYNVSKLEEKIKQNENETAKAMDDAAVQRQTLKDMREQYDMLKR